MTRGELLNKVHLGDSRMVDGTRNGNHSKATILNLINPVLGHLRRILGQTKRVEEVSAWLAVRLSINHLNRGRKSHDLEEGQPDQELEHRAVVNTPVVTLVDEMRKIPVPRELIYFSHDITDNSEHADAAMLDFSLLQPLNVDIVRDGQRI